MHQLFEVMRKLTFCISQNKGADQLCSNCEADQRLCFRFYVQNFQPLAIFCVCTARFVSDLFGNHIVGFLTRRLIYSIKVWGSLRQTDRLLCSTSILPPWPMHDHDTDVLIFCIQNVNVHLEIYMTAKESWATKPRLCMGKC